MNTWKDGKSKKNGNAEIESHGFPSWEHSAWSSRLLTWVALEASCSSSLCHLVSIDSISCFVHFLENMWGSPIAPNQDLVRLNWISQSLVPNKQVATGGLSALTTPWKLPAGPTQLPGVALKDDPAWKTEKTSATLNCVRGSDRYHGPESCTWNKLNI